jgi:hypothetical protein
MFSMCLLVVAHGGEYVPAALIIHWQLFQMRVEVSFHLSLRLGDEAEADRIAGQTGNGTDGKGARIPQGLQQAGAAAQFRKPGFAPGQVVCFLTGRLFEQVAGGRIAGYQGLSMVKALGGHFSGMVDPHQGCGNPSTLLIQGHAGATGGGAAGPNWGKQRP